MVGCGEFTSRGLHTNSVLKCQSELKLCEFSQTPHQEGKKIEDFFFFKFTFRCDLLNKLCVFVIFFDNQLTDRKYLKHFFGNYKCETIKTPHKADFFLQNNFVFNPLKNILLLTLSARQRALTWLCRFTRKTSLWEIDCTAWFITLTNSRATKSILMSCRFMVTRVFPAPLCPTKWHFWIPDQTPDSKFDLLNPAVVFQNQSGWRIPSRTFRTSTSVSFIFCHVLRTRLTASNGSTLSQCRRVTYRCKTCWWWGFIFALLKGRPVIFLKIHDGHIVLVCSISFLGLLFQNCCLDSPKKWWKAHMFCLRRARLAQLVELKPATK